MKSRQHKMGAGFRSDFGASATQAGSRWHERNNLTLAPTASRRAFFVGKMPPLWCDADVPSKRREV
jgi:hypothetical protein